MLESFEPSSSSNLVCRTSGMLHRRRGTNFQRVWPRCIIGRGNSSLQLQWLTDRFQHLGVAEQEEGTGLPRPIASKERDGAEVRDDFYSSP